MSIDIESGADAHCDPNDVRKLPHGPVACPGRCGRHRACVAFAHTAQHDL